MEWRKGFLTEKPPPKKSTLNRKANALPDDAFLPEDTYDLMDDEADAVDPRIAELENADEAYEYSVEYSRSHINLYNQGMIKITPETNLQFCEDLRVVAHNRKFFGHHDGPGKGGTKKKMLLPSGIVMSYQEWGAEAAPPIVLLHDISDCSHFFDEIARPLADKYRVLVPEPRGHGESTHSPSHQYGIEHLVEDLHEMVVRLSLNGRDWGGAWTRPWVLGGRGMGAAIATAYAARHKGRVAGLVLWDFDPEWQKDRLNFYPYQAAHFQNQLALASFLNDKLGLQEDGKYLSITFVNRCHALDIMEDAKGCEFNMDKHFFISDFNPGIAWAMLREAATKCKVMLLWSQNSREWSYQRVSEIASSLQSGEHKGVDIATVNRGTAIDKESGHALEDFAKMYVSVSGHVMTFADGIDKESRAALKAQGMVRYEKVSEEEIAMQNAEKESLRMAAREAAEAMAAEDKPIDIDDDLLD
jgi:pimeloyl-ACP methyl ester carboxylesterase